jgi:anhydro-N-acetylmuramic acid kinase
VNLYIGLMSGTSMDGIDAALVDTSTQTCIAGLTKAYSTEAKKALNQVLINPIQPPGTYSQLNTILGREFGLAALELLKKSQKSPQQIRAIGSHGQTICHDAQADIPYTIQLACPHTIAEMTGITVVADFRTRDLIAGGKGAPFAPLYHQALFKNQNLPLAIVNVGGIANITYLESEEEILGYDTGPGNCLMDAWVQRHHGLPYDNQGSWASQGIVIKVLLDSLLKDPFFHQSYPKSAGKEYFSLNWLLPHIKEEYSAVDIQATILELTTVTIAESLKMVPICPQKVLLCGGGAHNLSLLNNLQKFLPASSISTTSIFSIDPDFLEAMMFAWLAEKTLTNTVLDLNKITGAKNKVILGAIYPAGIDK